MAYYKITIDGGPITVLVYDGASKEDAYVLGVNKIRDALSELYKNGVSISPAYSKPTNIEYHADPDPRD